MEQDNNIVDILDLDDVKGISISIYFEKSQIKLSLVHAVLDTLFCIFFICQLVFVYK